MFTFTKYSRNIASETKWYIAEYKQQRIDLVNTVIIKCNSEKFDIGLCANGTVTNKTTCGGLMCASKFQIKVADLATM